ncbi:MAG: S8 family serine peptidase [Myxococcales bacterium]|nr:S8 family serine peptidase [Myxococcales bacterium]
MRRSLLGLLVLTPFIPGCACDEFFEEADGGTITGPQGRVSGTVTPFRGADSVQAPRGVVDATLKRTVLSQVNEGRTRLRVPSNAPRAVERAVIAPLPYSTSGRLLGAHERPRFVTGEVIVRMLEKEKVADVLRRVTLPGFKTAHGGFGSEFMHLVRFRRDDGRALSDGETVELVQQLARVPGVKWAELNRIRHPLAVPNDSLYSAMWHLAPINMPAAWELEKGSTASVTVAVIDTGIIQHPDLTPRVAQGADFISDADRAQDGDGRDSDATDPGRDLPNGASSWHGAHCAGTIGAVTDNGAGIAGVNWNARIVPVRVLGKGGGTDLDIAAGITWAAGATVPGMPANANPAQVISLSLGGEGEPVQTYQDAIDTANTRNAIVVVAAGNDNIDASRFTPCNQSGVLCIGATRFNGTRASYSNFGQRIDVMAPGGEVSEDANGDGNPDGVLSTVKNDATGMPSYSFEQGTSMATPHVAGIISLMKARNASLTFAQARQILTETANQASRCNEGCGAGLVNVHAALLRASGTQPMGPARLALSATDLFFTPATTSQSITITNVGGQPLTVTLAVAGTEAARVAVAGGSTRTIAPGATAAVQITGDLQGLATSVTGSATISATSNGGNGNISVKLRAGGAAGRNVAVALIHQVNGEWKVAAAVEAQAINNFSYGLVAPTGTYFLFGAQDANGNGQFEDEEPIGLWPNTDSPKALTITDGANLMGNNFVVAPQVNLSGDEARVIGTACTDASTCGTDGICATGFPQGYCTRDCETASCPAGAKCLSGATVSLCLETCAAPRRGRSTCRANYVCEDDSSGIGVCIPGCTAIADFCDAPQACNATTGYCE